MRKSTDHDLQNKSLKKRASSRLIDAFISHTGALGNVVTPNNTGRLIFGMDATASREPSWQQASQIQSDMFRQTNNLGRLQVQLCYYRGLSEFQASPWTLDTQVLLSEMNHVCCEGGYTQIEKLLTHALNESRHSEISALIFIGDCVEENIDALCQRSGQLGLKNIPLFIFHEGDDTTAAMAFKQMARLSGGAYSIFDQHSPQQLRELLNAVAIYAVGGKKALEIYSQKLASPAVMSITQQINKKP